MGPARVLFISPLFSPFQIELGREANRHAGIDYRVAFTRLTRAARGQPHWTRFQYDTSKYYVAGDHVPSKSDWFARIIRDFRPHVLISGQAYGPLFDAILATWANLDYRLGFWMEPPDFGRPWLYQRAASLLMRSRLSIADFVLAIGDRAERHLRRIAPRAKVWLLPYGADLSSCLESDWDAKDSRKIRFLFAGQLRKHHNVEVMMRALVETAKARLGEFDFTFAGTGPDRTIIDRYVNRHPMLRGVVRHEPPFEDWSARLRPFKRSHVLVFPTSYTGWGLVIPEAMAAGMVVVTTRQAEAARYFVRHRVNGLIIRPDAAELAREMKACIDDPASLRRMGERARIDARDGDAPAVAAQMAAIVKEVAGNRPRRSWSQRLVHWAWSRSV